MTSQFIGKAYLFLSALVLLFLAVASQKPHCINSQMIEKITLQDSSVVYRCVVNRKVPYSTEFVKQKDLIEDKILSFERWLSSNWQVKVKRLSLVFDDQATVTKLEGRTLYVWDQTLKNTSQVEVEITKNFVQGLNPKLLSANPLLHEGIAEFIVRIWKNNERNHFGGLATYFSYHLWNSYSDLKPVEKYSFLRNLPDLIKKFPARKFQDPETEVFEQMIQALEVFKSEKEFYANLRRQNDFDEKSFTASFDYLVLMSEARFGVFRNQDNRKNLGVWDGKFLYHLGSHSQMTASSFKKLKVRNLIWESCEDLDLQSMLNVKADVRKILVVRNCSKQNQPDYSQYVRRGIIGFAALHPQLSFVQLDMPSLNMRKDQIELQQKIFDLMSLQVQNKETQNSFFATFGLQKLNWDQKLQIYQPQSHIDAVETFRP